MSAGLYDAVNVVSGLFPFKPSLRALDGAINGGELLLPILHLLGAGGRVLRDRPGSRAKVRLT